MGVPKFFRWLSERYPMINQRYYAHPDEERCQQYGHHHHVRGDGNKKKRKKAEVDAMEALHFEDDEDIIGSATVAPEVDRLYIDMNGIIHGCSHNNNEDEDNGIVSEITEEEIFTNICFYLDRVISDIVKPNELVYLAIDGVAPRAKLNQQRSRRYRTNTDAEIEKTIYEAQLEAIQEQKKEREAQQHQNEEDDTATEKEKDMESSSNLVLKEVEPGRFAGKFETTTVIKKEVAATTTNGVTRGEREAHEGSFNSNAITPGTPFFQRCVNHLRHFIQYKISSGDPRWKDLTVIFSDSNVPGEGEHKIMDFMRKQKYLDPAYQPNLRHCIMGQDGDLMMLGLVTHEPNLFLLREQVIFDAQRRLRKEQRFKKLYQIDDPKTEEDHVGDKDHSVQSNDENHKIGSHPASGVYQYIFNPNFEFLHMNILRDYLSYEFETSNVIPTSPFDIEATIDDFVFMTFFVGNDFLPHIPALDIADEAFNLLFYTYRDSRQKWLEEERQKKKNSKKNKQQRDTNVKLFPYLTNSGEIYSGNRLEQFLSIVGSHEMPYYDNKKRHADEYKKSIRKSDAKFGTTTIPSDDILTAKEESDRAKYREMLMKFSKGDRKINENGIDGDSNPSHTTKRKISHPPELFTPVISGSSFHMQGEEHSTTFQPADETLEEGFVERLGTLIQYSVDDEDDDSTKANGARLDQDVKGRYYYDKFQFSPFDAEKHLSLRKAYIEGLVWNLKYYYEGCVSWDWYYPYHYGPMISDVTNIDEMLNEISFDGRLGTPLKPFEQLMACMPPSNANLLPKPYQYLMTDDSSPIIDFFPTSFIVDMNGKRWPWEAVVLLSFIDTNRLLGAAKEVTNDKLSAQEMERNSVHDTIVLTYDNTINESLPSIMSGNGSTKGGTASYGGGCFNEIKNCQVKTAPFDTTKWCHDGKISSTMQSPPVFKPELLSGVSVPVPGFPTLRNAPVRSLWRLRIGVDIFGMRSRYQTACLEQYDIIPRPIPKLEHLAKSLIGTIIYINYPYLHEAFVTAVSDEMFTIRGTISTEGGYANTKLQRRRWNEQEKSDWSFGKEKLIEKYELGEGMTGTGGLLIRSEQSVTLSVRPFKKVLTLSSGSKVKTFAKTEMEVPLCVTCWEPSNVDPRFADLPMGLEKNPYSFISYRQSVNLLPKFDEKLGVPQLEDNEDLLSTTEAQKPLDFYVLPKPSKISNKLPQEGTVQDTLAESKVLNDYQSPGTTNGKKENTNETYQTVAADTTKHGVENFELRFSAETNKYTTDSTLPMLGKETQETAKQVTGQLTMDAETIAVNNPDSFVLLPNGEKTVVRMKDNIMKSHVLASSKEKKNKKSDIKKEDAKLTATGMNHFDDSLASKSEEVKENLEKFDVLPNLPTGVQNMLQKNREGFELLPIVAEDAELRIDLKEKKLLDASSLSSEGVDRTRGREIECTGTNHALQSREVGTGIGSQTVSRRFSTHTISSVNHHLSRNPRVPLFTNKHRSTRNFSSARLINKSNTRGRLAVAAGFVALHLLFGSGSAASKKIGAPVAYQNRDAVPRDGLFPLSMRGGAIDEKGTFRIEEDENGFRSNNSPPLEFFHGTTTLSFVFGGGIIAAVDSRASLGSFVGSKTTNKVLPISSHLLGTMAGGAADCSFWIRKLRSESQLYEVTENHRMSVARVSRILSNMLYQSRSLQLSVGTMILGIDEDDHPSIYYIDNTGMRIIGDLFAVGSGATFALGILDTEQRYNMTIDEAIDLGIKAIRHATYRDAGSGGYVNVFLITKDGWRKVFSEDLATTGHIKDQQNRIE